MCAKYRHLVLNLVVHIITTMLRTSNYEINVGDANWSEVV